MALEVVHVTVSRLWLLQAPVSMNLSLKWEIRITARSQTVYTKRHNDVKNLCFK
jgi:hypothetical protein